MTPALARRASKSDGLAPWRAAMSAGMSVGAEPALNGNSTEHTGQRERHPGRCVRVGLIQIDPAGRNQRGEP